MKYRIIHILIVSLFLFNSVHVSAQWIKEIGVEAASRQSDKTATQLINIIKQDKAVLDAQLKKLAKIDILIKDAVQKNQLSIKIQKAALKKSWAKNPTSIQTISIQQEINKLESKTSSLEKSLERNLEKRNSFKNVTASLRKRLSKMKSLLPGIRVAGGIMKFNEVVGAGGGVFGEIYAWSEGSSSFKNVLIRAAKEGSKAVVSIGSGIAVGAFTATTTWNPFASGAAVVVSTIAVEGAFDRIYGRRFDYWMDREHMAINKYAADPKKLEEMRDANMNKAFKKNKALLYKIADKENEYNDELRKYIKEREKLWGDLEKQMRKDEAKQIKIETTETPRVIQRLSKKKIKLGESVIISIETTGGLLPITYSGAVSYIVETGYNRYLVAYKWSPDKKTEPGVYEFTVNATSASGKVGRNTVAIELIDPNPAPKPKAKPIRKSNLNIKKIPGGKIRKMIYKVNGQYYGYCVTPPGIKTQKFEISLGVDTRNIEGKLGIAHFKQFAGSKTVPMSEDQKEAVLVKLRKKGYGAYLPYPDYLDSFYKVYFHAWGLFKKFDPVTGRIWGEIEGEASIYQTYVPKSSFKGFLEAKLNNGVITGTIKFKIGKNDYSFPFTAKQ